MNAQHLSSIAHTSHKGIIVILTNDQEAYDPTEISVLLLDDHPEIDTKSDNYLGHVVFPNAVVTMPELTEEFASTHLAYLRSQIRNSADEDMEGLMKAFEAQKRMMELALGKSNFTPKTWFLEYISLTWAYGDHCGQYHAPDQLPQAFFDNMKLAAPLVTVDFGSDLEAYTIQTN